jgi:predicted secreted hydrolase
VSGAVANAARRAVFDVLRRRLAAAGLLAAIDPRAGGAAPGPMEPFPPALPDRELVFPVDHGAHPLFRTEWWYLTGWLEPEASRRAAQRPEHDGGDDRSHRVDRELGFQVTFFRSRTAQSRANPSRFAPHQLLFAHAGVTQPARGHLRHDQRAARAGFGLAEAATTDTDLSIGDWTLRRMPDDRYHAVIPAAGFLLDLRLTPHYQPVPQGERGFSRKGPDVAQASHYYSRPRLQVDGRLRIADAAEVTVGGTAWLDHEWSSEQLHADASGWDWVGLNLDDGSALMAFVIRRRTGEPLWRHARWIDPSGRPAAISDEPVFEPWRWWTSPRTGTRYPVAMALTAGHRTLVLQPLIDDQELDSRASTGVLYWEGAVRVIEGGRPVGLGYLELTGYGSPVRY